MEWQFRHRVEYEADARSIEDVIENLISQKRLIEAGAGFLCAAIGAELQKTRIEVEEIESGSIIFELLVLLYTEYQDNIEDSIVEGIEAMIGSDVPPELEALVTLAALAVVFLVAKFAYDAVRGKKANEKPSVHIEGNYNTVIEKLSVKLSISPDDLRALLEEKVPRQQRRALLRSAMGFFGLARRKRGSKIKVDGYGDIQPELIAELPNDAELSEIDDTRNIDVPDAVINIRATDKDKNKTGWAARIEGDSRFPRRMPMDLYPTVNAERLAKLDRVQGDLVIEVEPRPNGGFTPKRIHLLNFRSPSSDDFTSGQEGQEGP